MESSELLQRLQQGIATLTTSEAWTRWLDVQRRFHKYSFGNTLLICLQRPDASQVAGYRAWPNLGRHVRSGEKARQYCSGIRVLHIQSQAFLGAVEPNEMRRLTEHRLVVSASKVADLRPLDLDDTRAQIGQLPCSKGSRDSLFQRDYGYSLQREHRCAVPC